MLRRQTEPAQPSGVSAAVGLPRVGSPGIGVRLRSYLATDVLRHCLAVSSVLLAIIFTGRFVRYLAEAASGKVAADVLLPVMLYRLPGFLELLLPLGLFIGILMAYGRLYVESEMVVLSACGIGPGRLARYTLSPALLIAVIVALLALVITPRGAERSAALLSDPRALQGLQLLAAGRFQRRGDDGSVTYAASVDPQAGELQRVFAFHPVATEGEVPAGSVLLAARGRMVREESTGVRYLELEDGRRYQGQPGSAAYEVVRFQRYGERLPDDTAVIKTQPVDARPTLMLWESTAADDRAALHWRLSLVTMVPVVALLALALSKTNHRRGRYLTLAPALVLHLSYLFLLATVRSRVAEEGASVGLFWTLHGLFLCLALLLLYAPQLRLSRR
jgi:lipopolysaccharide export system permease protein